MPSVNKIVRARDRRRRKAKTLLGWRDVPVNNSKACSVPLAKSMPVDPWLFLDGQRARIDAEPTMFERKPLYVVRRSDMPTQVTRAAGHLGKPGSFYICSHLVEHGDLQGPAAGPSRCSPTSWISLEPRVSAAALVRRRHTFSTNTFPTWELLAPATA